MSTMREEFESILRDFGHNVLVVRQNKKFRCSCWSEKNQEASVNCSACFGLGYVPVVEKHTVRHKDTSVPETLARLIQQPEVGNIAVPGKSYYVKHDVNVVRGDLIVEVEWTESGKPYYQSGGIYEINHINSLRWERGEVIYKTLYTKGEPVEQNIRGIRISNINGFKNYEILR